MSGLRVRSGRSGEYSRSAGHSPRRACLSVPGSAERMLAKVGSLGADEYVLDLEDAVAPAVKDDARALVAAALSAIDPAVQIAVRVNPAGTEWHAADVEAVVASGRAKLTIVVPKVESAAQLEAVKRPVGVQALIESPAGLLAAPEIARVPGVESLIIGYADLGAALGGRRSLDDWRPAQERVLWAARAAGVQAIDGPHLGTSPDEAFTASASRARDLGYDGKWAIHPAQVGPLVEIFTPGEEEVRQAREIVAALAAAEREGRGAVAHEGQMLDEAVRLAALRTLARAGETE